MFWSVELYFIYFIFFILGKCLYDVRCKYVFERLNKYFKWYIGDFDVKLLFDIVIFYSKYYKIFKKDLYNLKIFYIFVFM